MMSVEVIIPTHFISRSPFTTGNLASLFSSMIFAASSILVFFTHKLELLYHDVPDLSLFVYVAAYRF